MATTAREANNGATELAAPMEPTAPTGPAARRDQRRGQSKRLTAEAAGANCANADRSRPVSGTSPRLQRCQRSDDGTIVTELPATSWKRRCGATVTPRPPALPGSWSVAAPTSPQLRGEHTRSGYFLIQARQPLDATATAFVHTATALLLASRRMHLRELLGQFVSSQRGRRTHRRSPILAAIGRTGRAGRLRPEPTNPKRG
jgi:hypothetical protein